MLVIPFLETLRPREVIGFCCNIDNNYTLVDEVNVDFESREAALLGTWRMNIREN